ncbi:hypothetical protein FRB98_000074 [Tulasnella sp. 332]|nr:hypothetical protein FRB98_000074 [Tulasnella sp. 332]
MGKAVLLAIATLTGLASIRSQTYAAPCSKTANSVSWNHSSRQSTAFNLSPNAATFGLIFPFNPVDNLGDFGRSKRSMILRRHDTSHSNLAALFFALLVPSVLSQPALLPFTDCSSSTGEPIAGPRYINVTAVYAQISDYGEGSVIKYDVFGETGGVIEGATPTLLATLFKTSTVLSFNLDETASAFCQGLRAPSSAVPAPDEVNCTIPAGPVAFSASTPLRHDFHLTTIQTRLHAVDASSPPYQLVCIDVQGTPVVAKGRGGYYGNAIIIFWSSVGLAAAYWIVIGSARIAAAWDRGGARHKSGWLRFKWAGTVLASAISGEKLASTPALTRFSTPSLRDIIFHTQWCAGLAMVAVQWPTFIYPILRNTAWATLVYNVTVIQGGGEHWDAVDTSGYAPPSNFADQLANASSPLFMNPTVQNQLFLLPANTSSGMASFAYAVGIRPQDLFGTCLAIYLCIVAGTVMISLGIWAGDWLISSVVSGKTSIPWGGRNQRYSVQSDPDPTKGVAAAPISPRPDEATLSGTLPPPPTSRVVVQVRKAWWNYRLGQSSFHGSVLYGNLVRILLLFHVPITLYSCFQFTVGRPDATIASLVLAVLAFVFLSLLLPGLLLFRLAMTSTGKLFEATRTLLMLGPLYYNYSPGQQSFAFLALLHNLVVAVVIGAGQGSGTTQAILLLIIEVLMALATSMRLPWGEGANMGAMSFMFCVGRIITCVLLVILSPVVNIGNSASGWVAYAVLIINGLIYIAFVLILLMKILEGLVRLFGRISFDSARHPSDTGLFGTIEMLSFFKRHRRRGSSARRHRYRPAHSNTGHEVPSPSTDRSSHAMVYETNSLSREKQHGTSSVPSYLRPEHARTPYKEDGDDLDKGYILGAFHDEGNVEPPMPPMPQQQFYHHKQYTQPPVPAQQPPSNTGFTRVKGGRANFDTPFAIRNPPGSEDRRNNRRTTESTSLVMTAYPPSSFTHQHPPSLQQQQSEPSPSSFPQPAPKKLAHGRRRSETAVIEDTSSFAGGQGPPSSRGPPTPTFQRGGQSPLFPPVMSLSMDVESEDSSVAPRRKYWFGGGGSKTPEHRRADSEEGGSRTHQAEGSSIIWPFRRGRNKSEPDRFQAAEEPEPGPEPGRSFQVVRRPQPRPSVPEQPSPGTASSTPNQGEDSNSRNPRRKSSPFGY